jgi:hypothetical protein
MLTTGGTLAIVGGRGRSAILASYCRPRRVSLRPTCHVSLGACNAPLWRFAVMVQRNAAGSPRVSLNDEDPNPKPEMRRGCRAKSCHEPEGVPKIPFFDPEEGGPRRARLHERPHKIAFITIPHEWGT